MYLTPSSLLLIPQINSQLISTKPAAYLPYAVTLTPSVFDISELNYLLIFMHSCLIPPEVRSDYTFAPSNPIVYTAFAAPPINRTLTIPMTTMDTQTVESGMYILSDCLTWLTIACPDCHISGERCSSSEGPSDVEAWQGCCLKILLLHLWWHAIKTLTVVQRQKKILPSKLSKSTIQK